MSIKLFGQFLVERGVISSDQLRTAFVASDDLSLAKLAITKGLLTTERAHKLLTKSDTELLARAVKVKAITPSQADYLSFLQKSDVRSLCRYLVDSGIADQDTLNHAQRDYDADQAAFTLRGQSLPQQLLGRVDIVAILSQTENLLKRYAITPAALTEPVPVSGRAELRDVGARVRFSGDQSGLFVLTVDTALASVIAGQMLGAMELHSPDTLNDAVAELCNLIAGAAASACAPRGHHLQIFPPQLVSVGTSAGTILDGAQWGLHTPWGSGDILVE